MGELMEKPPKHRPAPSDNPKLEAALARLNAALARRDDEGRAA
jgi:hypothetical protein